MIVAVKETLLEVSLLKAAPALHKCTVAFLIYPKSNHLNNISYRITAVNAARVDPADENLRLGLYLLNQSALGIVIDLSPSSV